MAFRNVPGTIKLLTGGRLQTFTPVNPCEQRANLNLRLWIQWNQALCRFTIGSDVWKRELFGASYNPIRVSHPRL